MSTNEKIVEELYRLQRAYITAIENIDNDPRPFELIKPALDAAEAIHQRCIALCEQFWTVS